MAETTDPKPMNVTHPQTPQSTAQGSTPASTPTPTPARPTTAVPNPPVLPAKGPVPPNPLGASPAPIPVPGPNVPEAVGSSAVAHTAHIEAFNPKMKDGDVEMVGAAGSVFNIRGSGFGTSRGRVTLNGGTIDTTYWADNVVKGVLPNDARPGPVTITMADGSVLSGHFGKKK